MKNRREILSNILENDDYTIFQKKVYRTISKIPEGEVRSYKWVAEKIGSPHSARAVGNALNRNPYPGPIPCHRVIRSDGSIGGYSGGVAKKKRLLRAERLGKS